MTTRRPGSGLSSFTAAAVENLLAATLRDDLEDVSDQMRALQPEYKLGRCGIAPEEIVQLISLAVDELGLDVTHAVAQPLDGLGDVRATLTDGTKLWFEVKAQTKKGRFADLTQADWVRDETDLICWLANEDTSLANQLPQWVRMALEVSQPDTYFAGWSRNSLWLADMALITNRSVRERAGIISEANLQDFLSRKYVLHLTREGVRIIRLDAVAPIAASLTGSSMDVRLNFDNQTAASIAISCPGPAIHGSVHFTYHVGYASGVLGRHKMHARSLSEALARVEVLL